MTIKVWPKDDEMRKLMKHPSGIGFVLDSQDGADWPDDTYTFRRLRDGDIVSSSPGGVAAAPRRVAAKDL